MSDPQVRNPQSEQSKWIRGDGLRAKLLRSHLAIALLGMGMLGTALVTELSMRSTGVQIAEQDEPLAWHSMRALTGLQRSLAGLRGWMALGEKSFIDERIMAWADEIEPSLEVLEVLSRAAADPEHARQVQRLREILRDLKETQWWIEDVAQTPGNLPAHVILIRDLEPIGRTIESAITALFESEKDGVLGAQC